MDRAKYLTALHTRFGLSDREVVDIVERSTGRRIAATRRLISGDENEVHLVELDDGGSVYLRVAFPGAQPAKAKHEAWAMSRATDGGVPVPSVIAIEAVQTDDGERTAMVLEAAKGRQLKEVLPRLSRGERSRAMVEVGRVLGVLHSLSMPGAGVPDDQGVWANPRTHREGYLAKCLTACAKLESAGFSPADVRRVVGVLENSSDVPVADPPVLCHGDVYPDHVFVDSELRVAGVIDWGMWRADSAVSELAGLSVTSTVTDFESILSGHGDTQADSTFRYLISWHKVAQTTCEIEWLVDSSQTGELAQPASALRSALNAIG